MRKASSDKENNVITTKNAKDLAVRLADEARNNATSALTKLASVKKRDAISVYGSFNSDTKAAAGTPSLKSTVVDGNGDGTKSVESPGVHLAIGKVFSTGVAAQNLSEAQKSIADAASFSACVQTVEFKNQYFNRSQSIK